MLKFFVLWLILTRDDNIELVFTYTLNFYLFQKLGYAVINFIEHWQCMYIACSS